MQRHPSSSSFFFLLLLLMLAQSWSNQAALTSFAAARRSAELLVVNVLPQRPRRERSGTFVLLRLFPECWTNSGTPCEPCGCCSWAPLPLDVRELAVSRGEKLPQQGTAHGVRALLAPFDCTLCPHCKVNSTEWSPLVWPATLCTPQWLVVSRSPNARTGAHT